MTTIKTAEIQLVWIPQVPLRDGEQPFTVDVPDLDSGKLLHDALAQYDLYQYNHKIKPDYSNVGWLQYRLPGDEDWDEVNPDDEDEMAEAKKRLR